MLQRVLLDAEGAVQLLDGGAALLHLLRQPAAALADSLGAAAALAPGQAAAAADAFRGAHAAASLLASLSRLAPADCWAEVGTHPGLLTAAACAFSQAAAIGCCILPEVAEPAVASLQRAALAALAPLADAIALLAQASAGSPEQLAAGCSCTPLPLAAAVATAMNSPKLPQARLVGLVRAACCRLLAVLLQDEAEARCFLQDSQGQEHQLPSADPDASSPPAGAALSTCLMVQWLEAAAAASGSEQGSLDEQQQRQVLNVALGGLLAFSASAKRVAVDAGMHSSLLDSCRALAVCLAGPGAAGPLQPLPQPTAAAHRTAKLQQLREARRSGTKQPAAVLAFGSRVPAAAPAASGRSASRSSFAERAGSDAAAVEAGPDSPAQPTADTADVVSQAECRTLVPQAPSPGNHPQPRQQQLLVSLLGLLQRLAHSSAPSCSSLVEAGAMEVAALLWGAHGSTVQASLLSLLTTLLHNSAAARAACASTGEQARQASRLWGNGMQTLRS